MSRALGDDHVVEVESDLDAAIGRASLLVLPGVGAFGPAAARLGPARERVRDALVGGLPALGICLGMQLLFEGSEEGPGLGLGVLRGSVTRMRSARLPHMGWSPLAASISGDVAAALPQAAYFAHSYACRAIDPEDVVATSSVDGETIAAVVRRGRTFGCQFHPEKSSTEGLRLLGAIAREATR
jgi:imidazole glycerol-phosphate synthase subunit HisH